MGQPGEGAKLEPLGVQNVPGLALLMPRGKLVELSNITELPVPGKTYMSSGYEFPGWNYLEPKAAVHQYSGPSVETCSC